MANPIIYLLLAFFLSQCTPTCLGYNSTISRIAAQYASCASVTTDYLPQISNWTYTYCLSAQPQFHHILDLTFIHLPTHNLFAFLLYDKQRDIIVLAFRATVCGGNNSNGKTDLNVELKLYKEWGCRLGLCQVHSGFINSYDRMRDEIRGKLLGLVNKYPSAGLMVTGVSLGGALAAIASYDLKMYLKSLTLTPTFHFYTFGQPRIGNQFLARQFNKQLTLYRVVDSADPVPHLPPRKLPQPLSDLIYYHPGIQIYYPQTDSNTFSICAGDNNGCSLLRKGGYQVCNHLYYPLMNINGDICNVKNINYDFGITELQSLEENEKIIKFFMYQCGVSCKHMDPMLCPYYRIPQLHCEPLEYRKGLLIDLIELIGMREGVQEIDAALNPFQALCRICVLLSEKHSIRKQ